MAVIENSHSCLAYNGVESLDIAALLEKPSAEMEGKKVSFGGALSVTSVWVPEAGIWSNPLKRPICVSSVTD